MLLMTIYTYVRSYVSSNMASYKCMIVILPYHTTGSSLHWSNIVWSDSHIGHRECFCKKECQLTVCGQASSEQLNFISFLVILGTLHVYMYIYATAFQILY